MPTSTGAMLSGGVRRKRHHKYVCGVPANNCTGAFTSASNGLKKSCKMHSSPQEAHKCYARYLLRQGYTQIGSREFAAPNGGPIIFLTKKSRFGARCRGGKAERFMPSNMVGGHIISC
jgi:hypothetical protein